MPSKTVLKREPKKPLTAEERAALTKQRNEAREKDRLAAAAIATKLPHLSHRQLTAEIKRMERRDYTKEGYSPSLNLAFATTLRIVLANTRTTPVFEADKNGKPTRVARLDQINQLGVLHAYPR